MKVLARCKLISKKMQFEYGLVDYPNYGYGLLKAALEAKFFKFEEMFALEFGVDGGNGLVKMEEYSIEISKLTGIKIHVVGFDTGHGMTAPKDFRDAPYMWQQGVVQNGLVAT